MTQAPERKLCEFCKRPRSKNNKCRRVDCPRGAEGADNQRYDGASAPAMTYKEIGAELGITKEGARLIGEMAIARFAYHWCQLAKKDMRFTE